MNKEKVVVKESTYSDIEAKIADIFSEFDLELRNKKVLIKPNMLTPTPPDEGNTTHPAVIEAVVKYVKEFAREVIVGDNPGGSGYGSNERCANITGILKASRGNYVNLGAATKKIDVDLGHTDSVVVSEAVLDADVIISLPKCKTHIQTILTGGIKNMYGILAGNAKAFFHSASDNPNHFAEIVVDVFGIRRPDLTIMDAIVAMEGNGPTNGNLRDVNKIMASRNAVHLDTVMAEMMGISPTNVPLLEHAYEKNMGEIDLANIEVKGEWEQIPDFEMGANFSKGFLGKIVNILGFSSFKRGKVAVRMEDCTRCGVCVKSCPEDAIGVDECSANINHDDCDLCYCCKEVCVYDAIEVTGLAKLSKKLFRWRLPG